MFVEHFLKTYLLLYLLLSYTCNVIHILLLQKLVTFKFHIPKKKKKKKKMGRGTLQAKLHCKNPHWLHRRSKQHVSLI